MTSPSLLHPHSRLLFIIVPLTSLVHACTHTTSRHYPSHTCNLFLQVGLPCMHTHTPPPLHHFGILYVSQACAMIGVPLCVCIYSQVFPSFPHKLIDLYIQSGVTLFPTYTSINLYLSIQDYIANTPTLIIYPTSPSHHPCLSFISQTRAQWRRQGAARALAPLTSLYIEANMIVISRSIVGKMV